MGKSNPKPPPAPDPVATAQAQADANTKAAITQAGLNRIDQVTPEGSLRYSQIGTNPDGTPRYQQTQTYSPEQQALYDTNNKIAQALNGVAVDNIGRVGDAQSKAFSFDGMTPVRTGVDGKPIQTSLDYSGVSRLPNPDDFQASADKASDMVYRKIAARLDPRFAQVSNDTEARLANSGISENSDAYRRERDNLSRDRNDAYDQAAGTAYAAGQDAQQQAYAQALATRQQGVSEVDAKGQFANTAAAQDFNQEAADAAFNNQARQQQITEASYLRNIPINEIVALLGGGGGVQTPQFQQVAQVGVAAPDYQGAVYKNYDAANEQYKAAQAARGSALGSIFGLAGTLGSAYLTGGTSLAAKSDRRLKKNIVRVGRLANGLDTYTYQYIGETVQRFGVMAQEALSVVPEAVGISDDGYYNVDYSKVWGV